MLKDLSIACLTKRYSWNPRVDPSTGSSESERVAQLLSRLCLSRFFLFLFSVTSGQFGVRAHPQQCLLLSSLFSGLPVFLFIFIFVFSPTNSGDSLIFYSICSTLQITKFDRYFSIFLIFPSLLFTFNSLPFLARTFFYSFFLLKRYVLMYIFPGLNLFLRDKNKN